MISKNDIKIVRSLSDKSAREEHGVFIVEGEKMVAELLSSNLEVVRLYVTERCTAQWSGAEEVSMKDMERMSALKTPSTALAVARIPQWKMEERVIGEELVIALDNVQDPGNMGTIIRLADWFGVKHIICSATTADCFNPKVVQATMGALYRVQVHYGDLYGWLQSAAQRGVEIYGTLLEGEHIYSAELDNRGVLVMGNEGRGISEQVKSLISTGLFIPPYPVDDAGSESLNVAVATAVACSEFRRRLATK